MSITSKIMNIIKAHPKLVTFGIGVAITFVGGTAIGMILDPSNVLSASVPVPCSQFYIHQHNHCALF
jgi:hypothetical protein